MSDTTCSRRGSSSRELVKLRLLLYAATACLTYGAAILRLKDEARDKYYTSRRNFLCNELSENSPVFEKPQRIGVRSSLTCVSFRNFYISQERCCCHLERPYWFSERSVIFDYYHFLDVSSRNCTERRSVCVNVTPV